MGCALPFLILSSIAVIYYYLCNLPEPSLETIEPHAAKVEATLNIIFSSEAADSAKEECVCHLLTFLSSLLEKDDKFNLFVGRIFELFVPYVVNICQYPKSLLASLRLINAYSRYCELNVVSGVLSFMW